MRLSCDGQCLEQPPRWSSAHRGPNVGIGDDLKQLGRRKAEITFTSNSLELGGTRILKDGARECTHANSTSLMEEPRPTLEMRAEQYKCCDDPWLPEWPS